MLFTQLSCCVSLCSDFSDITCEVIEKTLVNIFLDHRGANLTLIWCYILSANPAEAIGFAADFFLCLCWVHAFAPQNRSNCWTTFTQFVCVLLEDIRLDDPNPY